MLLYFHFATSCTLTTSTLFCISMPDQLKLTWMSKVLSVCPCQQYGALRHRGINLSSLPSCSLSPSPKREGTHGLYSSVVSRSYNSYLSSSYFLRVCADVFNGYYLSVELDGPSSHHDQGQAHKGPTNDLT